MKKNTKCKVATIRWTLNEWKQVTVNAQRCGMRPSAYVRAVVGGYRPRLAMTPEEMELAHAIQKGRQDILSFANAINGATKGMTAEQRTAYILSFPNLRIWWTVMERFLQLLDTIISNLKFQK